MQGVRPGVADITSEGIVRDAATGGVVTGAKVLILATDGRLREELLFVKLRYKRPDGETSRLIEQPITDRALQASTDLRFAASVAAFGMLLRESEHRGDFTLTDVIRLAREALGDDPGGYRAEFVSLVEATRELGLLESGSVAAGRRGGLSTRH